MATVTCECGHVYEDTCKFCPECAAPNPHVNKSGGKKKFTVINQNTENKQEVKSTPTPAPAPTPAPKQEEEPVSEEPVRKKNIKPDSLSGEEKRSNKPAPKKKPAPVYEDNEDLEDEETPDDGFNEAESEDIEEFEDDPSDDYDEFYANDDDDSDEDEDDDDGEWDGNEADEDEGEDGEDDDEEDYEEYIERITVPKVKLASAPARVPTKKPQGTTQKRPKEVSNSSKRPVPQKKPSSVKSKKAYDPNHDGYYDDRLPAILDEITKTSHIDVILKGVLAVVCVAALIVYCIFYVNF